MSRSVYCVRPVHPADVLREDFSIPLAMSVDALALALAVPANCIHGIVKELRALTADATSWVALQAAYDLKALV